jgi:hypothetical protein
VRPNSEKRTHDEELAALDVARVEQVRLGGVRVVRIEPPRVRPRTDVGALGVREPLQLRATHPHTVSKAVVPPPWPVGSFVVGPLYYITDEEV